MNFYIFINILDFSFLQPPIYNLTSVRNNFSKSLAYLEKKAAKKVDTGLINILNLFRHKQDD
jgi:hypothetical protein